MYAIVVMIVAVALTSSPVAAARPAAPTVCQNGVCDGGKDPSTAAGDIALEPVVRWSRRIVLHVSYPDGMGWADIDNGSPGDETWLDRSFDLGSSWDSKLGDTFIPGGSGGWRTQMYFISDRRHQPAATHRGWTVPSPWLVLIAAGLAGTLWFRIYGIVHAPAMLPSLAWAGLAAATAQGVSSTS
jgi:hypothetical protein